MAAMYQRVVAAITKPPQERNVREIEPLLPWIRKKSELFNSLKQDVIVDIIRNCEFAVRQRDDVIIRQGEKGDCFYILLTGRVSIFINQLISDDEAGTEELAHANKGGPLDRSKFGNFIAVLDAGKSFGELALINKDCVRNASIIADETSDLLVVNRELYNRSLRAAQAAEFEERKNFIANNQLFHNWQQKYRKQLAMSLRKQVVQFDSYIAKQGESTNALYFILRGTAKIVVESSHHVTQYPNLPITEDPEATEKADILESLLPSGRNGDSSHFRERQSSVPPSAARRREVKRRAVEVSLVGANEMIGEVELTMDLPTYMQSVICMQTCEVYALDLKNYERLVAKRNKHTIDQIRECAAMKLFCRVSRLTDNQVPLYKLLLYKIYAMQQKLQPKEGRKRKDTRSPGLEESAHGDIVPPRGPLIDLYGPGTVFHRSKMRAQAKQKQRHKQGNAFSRGATSTSLPAPQFAQTGAYLDDTENYEYYQATEYDEGSHYEEQSEDLTSNGSIYLENGTRYSRKQFHDWESSDRALTMLEERIKQWHAGLTAKPPKDTIKLRRVTVEDGKEVKPGKKIFLRLKKPSAQSLLLDNEAEDDVSHSGNHRHSTRFSRRHTLIGPDGITTESESAEDGIEATRPNIVSIKHTKSPPKQQYTLEEYRELRRQMETLGRTMGMAFAETKMTG